MYNAITISLEVADRLKQRPDDLDGSFSFGHAGIACLFAELEKNFPGEGWKDHAFESIRRAALLLEENGFQTASMFHGLSGLCFATFLSRDGGNHYQKLQERLDDALLENLEHEYFALFPRILRDSEPVDPKFYNLNEGLSGVLAYLLLRKEEGQFAHSAQKIIDFLCDLFGPRSLIQGFPRWYRSSASHRSNFEKENYPEGSYNLGMSMGLSGVVSVLSFALLEGFRNPHLSATIEGMAHWLREQEGESPYGPTFPHVITPERTSPGEINRDIWLSGIPAVACALYHAGRAIKNLELQAYAVSLLEKMFEKPIHEWNSMAASFTHGLAGILMITVRIGEETQNPKLLKQAKNLEEKICSFYRPASRYGYQAVSIDDRGNYTWAEQPGLAIGAAGIALTLLNANGRKQSPWDRAFLIQ